MQAGGCRPVTGNKAWAPLHESLVPLIQSALGKLLCTAIIPMQLPKCGRLAKLSTLFLFLCHCTTYAMSQGPDLCSLGISSSIFHIQAFSLLVGATVRDSSYMGTNNSFLLYYTGLPTASYRGGQALWIGFLQIISLYCTSSTSINLRLGLFFHLWVVNGSFLLSQLSCSWWLIWHVTVFLLWPLHSELGLCGANLHTTKCCL